MIELQNVSKAFGQRMAVQNLSLTVPPGEIFGLLGHNGAGKSTAIGMMLGQVWPTEGEVRICGFDVANDRQRALRKVGAIFETPVFYDYLSGWRNLEIFSHYAARTSKQRLQEVVDWVGLTGRENSKVKTYSHGMRARLALAQALLPEPDLLILDEPGDGLDPEGIHEMRQTILRLRAEMGLTILLSSHLLSEVEQLCTRIAVMNQGRKVFDGPLASIHEAQNWVRLRVDNFSAAVKVLRQDNLIIDERDSQFIALAVDAKPAQVVRCLVRNDISVCEITPRQRDLEGFYLSLMKEDPSEDQPPNRAPSNSAT
ncbi:MAG TPA: ABC transporter ATP-binding protein [Verrucomicrobiae bacterium]|nr:ABC transporter ATP-binding protein [Verrucomicrobiae bacterium]